jgi:hypothetical protein
MRNILILVLLCIICSLVFADIGPSPSYNFSISNENEYSDYSFYYLGNIWEDTLIKVNDNIFVYKFNTNIKIFAIPKDFESEFLSLNEIREQLSEEKMDLVLQNSFVSDTIKLPDGKTVFKIVSLGENKKLNIEILENVPDVDYYFEVLSPVLLIVIVVIIIIGIIKLPVILKKLKK